MPQPSAPMQHDYDPPPPMPMSPDYGPPDTPYPRPIGFSPMDQPGTSAWNNQWNMRK